MSPSSGAGLDPARLGQGLDPAGQQAPLGLGQNPARGIPDLDPTGWRNPLRRQLDPALGAGLDLDGVPVAVAGTSAGSQHEWLGR